MELGRSSRCFCFLGKDPRQNHRKVDDGIERIIRIVRVRDQDHARDDLHDFGVGEAGLSHGFQVGSVHFAALLGNFPGEFYGGVRLFIRTRSLTGMDDVIAAEAGAVAGQGMCAEAVATAVDFADRQEDLLTNLKGQRA